MLPEIWKPKLTVVFVEAAVAEVSDTLGFHHLHPRDRFWELLELGGITPGRIISSQEREALAEGHANGSVSDALRVVFTEKKTSQLLRLGIGLTDVNRRVTAAKDKDKSARPTQADVDQFILKSEKLQPTILAFVMSPEIFVDVLKTRFPGANGALGPQPFTIGDSEVWFLGSTSGLARGEALTNQEDAFFALGERILALREGAAMSSGVR
jgi:G:T/U-mismatch repair DNA glycosylase